VAAVIAFHFVSCSWSTSAFEAQDLVHPATHRCTQAVRQRGQRDDGRRWMKSIVRGDERDDTWFGGGVMCRKWQMRMQFVQPSRVGTYPRGLADS
jgi:hypothetical protein